MIDLQSTPHMEDTRHIPMAPLRDFHLPITNIPHLAGVRGAISHLE